MSKKQASKRKRYSKATPILGAAGLSFTVATGAYGTNSTPAADMLWRNAGVTHGIALREEEISDVTLVTFHVFDKETQSGQQLACGCGGGCCLFARASPSGSDAYSLSPGPIRPARKKVRQK